MRAPDGGNLPVVNENATFAGWVQDQESDNQIVDQIVLEHELKSRTVDMPGR